MVRVFARRLWPDLIIQPHPVSEVKDSTNWERSRTPRVMEEEALWSSDLGMAGKFDR